MITKNSVDNYNNNILWNVWVYDFIFIANNVNWVGFDVFSTRIVYMSVCNGSLIWSEAIHSSIIVLAYNIS